MRIATFNLESLDLRSEGGVALDARAEALRPALERLCADILCLQEVNGQRRPGEHVRSLLALDHLLDGTRYAAYHRVFTEKGTGGVADVHNLVTLSRFPVASHRQLLNSRIAPLDYRLVTAEPSTEEAQSVLFERPILFTEIDAGTAGRLLVFNVHLRAPLASAIPGQKESAFVWRSTRGWAEGFYVSALKRAGQALELRLEIDALMDDDPHSQIIVCGDFNAEDHETPLKIVISAEEDTGNGLLTQRSMIVLDRSLPADRRFSVLHHGRPQMLDHILASRSLLGRFEHLEVHNETLADELVTYGRMLHCTSSSHAAVVAELMDV